MKLGQFARRIRLACSFALIASTAALFLMLQHASAAPAADGGVSDGSRASDTRVTPAEADQGLVLKPATVDTAPIVLGDWQQTQISRLSAELAENNANIAKIRQIKDLQIPSQLATLFGVDTQDPEAVTSHILQLNKRRVVLQVKLEEKRAQLAAITPTIERQIAQLTRSQRRSRRHTPAPEQAKRATEAKQRLALMQLELDVMQSTDTLLAEQTVSLQRTQAQRIEAHKQRQQAQAKHAERERQAAETARRNAQEREQAARAAQRAALEAQRKAHSEAARLLAGERAQLEGIRVRQAEREQTIANELRAMGALRARLERFRGQITAQAAELESDWPKTTPAFDALYGRIAAELVSLRPKAVSDLWRAIRGPKSPPRPADFSARLLRLKGSRRFAELAALRKELETQANNLKTQHQTLIDQRLALLQREVTWLNDHRTDLYKWLSPEKRRALAGLSRLTLEQLSREVSQLVFDAVYWSYLRINQFHQVPALLVDLLTVGRWLWLAVQFLFLWLLLRFTLKHWDSWIKAIKPQLIRAVPMGRSALRLAKLLDALRASGPPLLVLIVMSVIFRSLGGKQAATEVVVIYVVVFWVALYRIQLRLVESAARWAGLGRALAAISGTTDAGFGTDDDLEGPPEPREKTGEQPAVTQGPAPISVLIVRSARAATRYILVVLLILDLTEIAVGQGTIYHLTEKFSWWAALPFVFYFLELWRPHIVAAYLALPQTKTPGILGRWARRSQGHFYEIFMVAAAFAVVFSDRVLRFVREYLLHQDITRRVLAFIFKRRVEKHAREVGRVVQKRHDLPASLLDQFPTGAIERQDGALIPPVMDEITKTIENWQQAHADGSLVLVGEAGMGKSTTIRLLDERIGIRSVRGEPRTKIVRSAKVISWLAEVFGFSPKPSSEKELIRLIREDSRQIVAIDNCHNLFLRRVGGFDAWDCFVRIVDETCDTTFWLLAMNQAAWDYLYNVAGHVPYFRRVVRVAPWSERWIQRLIMLRMRRARQRVSFSDLVITRLPELDLEEQSGRTAGGYFRMLWDYTGGNPRLAGHFWLDSLVPNKEQTQVRVHLFAEPDIAVLEKLPPDMAFVLTAVAEHENLDVDETASTTRLPRDFCALAFNACLEDGYLERMSGTRVRLSTRWQRPVTRFLKRKHLLHESG